MSPPMSLLAKWRMGINEGRNYSEKDAKNGTKTRGPDQYNAHDCKKKMNERRGKLSKNQ